MTPGQAAKVAQLCYLPIPGVVELILVEGDESRPREERIRAMLALHWLAPTTPLPVPGPDLMALFRAHLETLTYSPHLTERRVAARQADALLAGGR